MTRMLGMGWSSLALPGPDHARGRWPRVEGSRRDPAHSGPSGRCQGPARGAGLTCSPLGSWPGSRRPSGWSSPAAGGPAACWGHSPAAPGASGSERSSKGHQRPLGLTKRATPEQGRQDPSPQTRARRAPPSPPEVGRPPQNRGRRSAEPSTQPKAPDGAGALCPDRGSETQQRATSHSLRLPRRCPFPAL